MRILVTNDDGIEAPGLVELARALHDAGHEIEVVAPSTDLSGSGTGMGRLDDGTVIGFRPHVLPGLPDVPATAVDAPPVFAVLAACTGALGARPDLVISGINDGFNTGRFLLASSTVGAALAGGALGVRGLAISAGFAPHHRFDTAAMIAVRTAEWMIEHSAPRTVLNVNVPDCGVEEIAGVRCAELAPRGLMGLRLDRRESELVLRQFVNDDGLGEGTDAALVAAGYVAVSALPSLSRVAHGDAAARSAEAIECGLRTGRTPRAETSC